MALIQSPVAATIYVALIIIFALSFMLKRRQKQFEAMVAANADAADVVRGSAAGADTADGSSVDEAVDPAASATTSSAASSTTSTATPTTTSATPNSSTTSATDRKDTDR